MLPYMYGTCRFFKNVQTKNIKLILAVWTWDWRTYSFIFIISDNKFYKKRICGDVKSEINSFTSTGILFLNKLLPSTISHTKSDILLNAKLTAVKIFIIQQFFCKTTQKTWDYGWIKKILLHHYGSHLINFFHSFKHMETPISYCNDFKTLSNSKQYSFHL